MTSLITWKGRRKRKPLLLRGARQTGKTWLMQEFGRRYFSQTAYVSFDKNTQLAKTFANGFDLQRILSDLNIAAGFKITPQDTLIIFDEVQECPEALWALKYFCEDAPEYPIIAAGSLLGMAIHSGVSLPVGKVDTLDLYPMTFREFLAAVGRTELAEALTDPTSDAVNTFAATYMDLLKKYYFVGGMPQAVESYASELDMNEVRRLQMDVLSLYEQDFGKHAPVDILGRIRMVWSSIPIQLARENKKFFFGNIQQGARAKDFELAIQWLTDCGLIHKVHRVSKPFLPLKSYADLTAFKLYMLDVGLLGALSGLDAHCILDGSTIFTEFKGALTEQYVLQQLVADTPYEPFYYVNSKSKTEIDFVVQDSTNIMPIEVKASDNLRSRSLQAYYQKFLPARAARVSMAGLRQQDWLTNVPLWAVARLPQI